MLITADLLTDLDLLALDSTILDAHGPTQESVTSNLAEKRRVAVEDWLFSGLKKAGYSPARHSVRYAPHKAFAYTAGVYTDITTAISDKSADDLNLASALASPSADAIFIGHNDPPAGLWTTVLDYPNTNSLAVASLSYWNGGRWQGFSSLADGTRANSLVSFSGGGRFSWRTPTDWQPRPLNSEADWRFWLRLTVASSLVSSATVTQLLPIQRSRLTTPAAYYTLHLLYQEGWGVQRGEWKEKAELFGKRAQEALDGAVRDLDEFLADETDGSMAQAVVPSAPVHPVRDLTSWERG